MVDKLTAEHRSALMRSVRQRDTSPEMAVRRALHKLGYRFRLHRKDLPGTPDVVLPRYRLAIFVHGCFWHRHAGCKLATTPTSNIEYWLPKFEANVARDARKAKELRELGWRVETVWQCETASPSELSRQLQTLIEGEDSR
ncbi:very short patch repair endonuclease [Burkholderia pseudomultivorans]|uniref:very short patch repair endonuclease n=1 Tax=Burkholderia pseudomultivorans TaxID=1207504 RepID=UPI0009BDB779|nr:DNA mismatch endonuclease Vsr [Burkholderia pseudomultivorans]